MSSKHYDILIVGAGLAGLTTAIGLTESSSTSPSVLLLEKNKIPGKKLLISGSGQCNISHTGPVEEFLAKYGDLQKSRFIKPALFTYSNQTLIDFFQKHGLSLIEDEGKIFPESRKSRDILHLLLNTTQNQQIELQTNQAVQTVEKTSNGFQVRTARDSFNATHLVLACGGASYPNTGCTGDGYDWATSLGHSIVPIKPGLTPLTVKSYSFADCSGIAIRGVGISLFNHHKPGKDKAGKRFGDVLLTHHGFSGPGILDFSRFCQVGTQLQLNWLGKMTREVCEEQLRELLPTNGKRSLKNVIQQAFGLPDRFLVALFKSESVDPDVAAAYVDQATRRKIASLLTAMRVEVESLGSFSVAMVTCGGVALHEVDRNHLESRLVPNLYFCGELLDVDGDTGGYNLQFAFSSGMLVAKTILSKLALLSSGKEKR